MSEDRIMTETEALKAARELRNKLSEAIEWAVNMDDLRKERKDAN